MMNEQAVTMPAKARFGWLDAARGLAVISMTVFHFAWDLEFFGYAPQGMTAAPEWKWFARTIASTFLILAGISFVLAHRGGLNRGRFLRRFAQIAAAAALISLATWFATPGRFVFFGILHQIAFASLVAALVLRLNAYALGAMAVAIFAINAGYSSELFDHPALWWLGLAPHDPPTNDFVPFFPWTGWVLAGMALGKIIVASPETRTARPVGQTAFPTGFLEFLGRHSLFYYLLHQPVMIGLLSAFSFVFPAPAPDVEAGFQRDCMATCLPGGYDEAFCQRFCSCVADDLKSREILTEVAKGEITKEDERVSQAALTCSATADQPTGP